MMVFQTKAISTLHFTVARGSDNRNHLHENCLKNCAKNCQAKSDVHDHQDSEFLDD